MVKSFSCVVILTAILMAHTVCTREAPGSYDNEIGDNEGEETEPPVPFLTCTLFKDNFACNAMCSILGSIYSTPFTSGECGEAKTCECEISSTVTLADYWNKKFMARFILQAILQNKPLSEKIDSALKIPFRTAHQTFDDIKPHLSASQIRSIRVKVTESQKIFTGAGIDKEFLQSFVSQQLKSLGKPQTNSSDYKKTLIDSLNNLDNEDVLDDTIDQIRESKNKFLNNIIDDYVKEQGIQEPYFDSEDQETIFDILDVAIINELIKPPPPPPPRRSTAVRPRPRITPTNSYTHPKPINLPASSASRQTPLEPNTQPAFISKITPPKPINQPTSPISTPNTDDSRWILDGFDKTEVDQHHSGMKCWEDYFFYKVCLHKGLYWVWVQWNNKKDKTIVDIQVNNNGDIQQKWSFENREVIITIDKTFKTGLLKENWSFPNTSLLLNKGSNGGIIYQRWRGPEEPQTIEKYRGFMEAWCANNDYFIGKDNCVIF